MVFQFTPDYLLCAENIPFVVMCAEDLNCDGESFGFNDSMLYRFVSREKAPFPLFHGSIRSVPSGCVTLLACPQKLPEGYAKEYGLDYSDNGVSSRFFNQFELDMNKEFGGLKKGCQYFLGGLHNLYTILPPNLYISSLNPSFYPYGNKHDRMKRKETVKKIVDYLQSIVDKQGDVWYIREWVPDKIALADSVEIRTMKVSDLDISGDEFEFELCVLYHFVK